MHSVELGRDFQGTGLFAGKTFVPIMETSCEAQELVAQINSVNNSYSVAKYLIATPSTLCNTVFNINYYLWAELK